MSQAKTIKAFMAKLISILSPILLFKLSYLHNRGKWPNLRNPSDISERWIKYYFYTSRKDNYVLADKYAVRNYVKERGLEGILTPCLGVWCNSEDIDFEQLPDRFALKMNYGAGMNVICENKAKLDIIDVKTKLKKWINRNYQTNELHYNLIERKIICEAFIEDGNGLFPTDYKILCYNGNPYCILVCSERGSGHPDYKVYDLDWNERNNYIKHNNNNISLKRPKHLSEMIEIASKLSKGIEMVRVDLYDTDEGVIFGEMTISPDGCIFRRWTRFAIDEMGAYCGQTISNKYINTIN